MQKGEYKKWLTKTPSTRQSWQIMVLKSYCKWSDITINKSQNIFRSCVLNSMCINNLPTSHKVNIFDIFDILNITDIFHHDAITVSLTFYT